MLDKLLADDICTNANSKVPKNLQLMIFLQ